MPNSFGYTDEELETICFEGTDYDLYENSSLDGTTVYHIFSKCGACLVSAEVDDKGHVRATMALETVEFNKDEYSGNIVFVLILMRRDIEKKWF